MSPVRTHTKHPTPPDQLIANELLHQARRAWDLDTFESSDRAIWSAPMRRMAAFGLRAVAEITSRGVLLVRDLETDEILTRSKPFAFDELDTDAPMVEEAMKAWGAARERQRRDPIVTGG